MMEILPLKANGIPADLTKGKRFVCWRAEERNRKVTKVPYNALTGHRASSTDPQTWTYLSRAINAFNNGGGYSGIGCVFTKDSDLCGVDLDKCRNPETGEVERWAQEIVDRLGSYTEVSPSGTGLKVFCRGTLPVTGTNKGNLEMYASGRYFTITGHHYAGTPKKLTKANEALNEIYKEHFGNTEATQSDTPPIDATPDTGPLRDADQVIIEQAKAFDPSGNFVRLYYHADFSGRTAGDGQEFTHSHADFALICHLAACTRDAVQLDRLFRHSALMRDKWDRKTGDSTYGWRTIQKALNTVDADQKPIPFTDEVIERLCSGELVAGKEAVNKPTDDCNFPSDVMAGVAGQFAEAYGKCLETPKEFLYMSFLTCLGNVLSGKLTLDSELYPQPRLYTVLLGASGTGRKSTAIKKAADFFKNFLLGSLTVCHGAGSPEGLAQLFDKNTQVLLYLDELKAFVQKSKIESSNLLPAVTTLFGENQYHNVTKKKKIQIDDAHLSLLAASTLDTYQTMFSSAFLDIGFINRLFIVVGESERRFSIPQAVPGNEIGGIKKGLSQVLQKASQLSREDGNGAYMMPMTPKARDLFHEWYLNMPTSVFATRLDAYGHRLMPLLAINEEKRTVDEDIVTKVLKLLDYQFSARKQHDPVDADNKIAALEESIRRQLSRGPLKRWELGKRCHKSRYGIWAWKTALANLNGEGEVIFDNKSRQYIRLETNDK